LIAAGMDGPRLARPTLHQAGHADRLRSYPATLPQAKPPNPPLPPARLANQVESLPTRAKSAQPHVEPQLRAPTPPVRPQRSLEDLRGLRNLGRQETARNERDDEEISVEEVDVPPFLRKFD